jgi:hypothetical protein
MINAFIIFMLLMFVMASFPLILRVAAFFLALYILGVGWILLISAFIILSMIFVVAMTVEIMFD